MKHKNIITIIAVLLVVASIVAIEMSKPKVVNSDNADKSATKVIDGKSYKLAPDVQNIAGWINSEPLSVKDLEGKVVLIDFWTYSCINCIRTFPYLNSWSEKYFDDGLVIIGVHTPEFDFEKDYDNVLMATQKYDIKFSVALDNDYGTWSAYKNNYWPRKYLIDKNGYIRYDHIGEGGYEETERMIQKLLSEDGKKIQENLVDIKEETPTTSNTRELYLGFSTAIPRGQNIGNDGGLIPLVANDYIIDGEMHQNVVYLEGQWTSKNEAVLAGGNSSMYLDFHARKAHVVLDGRVGTKLYVTIDGKPVNTQDVVNGYLNIDSPRLYTVYDGDYGDYSLKIYSNESGVSINSFTFG